MIILSINVRFLFMANYFFKNVLVQISWSKCELVPFLVSSESINPEDAYLFLVSSMIS